MERMVVLETKDLKKYYKTGKKIKVKKDIKRYKEQMTNLCFELFGYNLEADLIPVKVREEKIDGELKFLAFEYEKLKNLHGKEAFIRACENINIKLYENETLGLVGEFNSGKNALAEVLAKLNIHTDGKILFCETDVDCVLKSDLKVKKRHVAYVMKHDGKTISKNTILDKKIEKALLSTKLYEKKSKDLKDRVIEILTECEIPLEAKGYTASKVGLYEKTLVELAVGIAHRAKLVIIGDEFKSRDKKFQDSFMKVVKKLQGTYHFALIVVSNDIKQLENYCDKIAVMNLGSIVEIASAKELLSGAQHPYVKLIANGEVTTTEPFELGITNINLAKTSGCLFHDTCPIMREVCTMVEPTLDKVEGNRCVACHFKGSNIE